jgi:cytochrome P450
VKHDRLEKIYVGTPRKSVSCYEVEVTLAGDRLIRKGDDSGFPGHRAANHGPTEFADPLKQNLLPTPNRHLAFGTCVYHCLGGAPARSETGIVLPESFSLYPSVELTDDDHRSLPGITVRALEGFPIRVEA